MPVPPLRLARHLLMIAALVGGLHFAMPADATPPATPLTAIPAADPADPWLWLEDVGGDDALGWVRERNAECIAELTADDHFAEVETRIRSILDSDEKIPYVRRIGEHWYNFWRDAEHPRGLWRRTTPAEYHRASPPAGNRASPLAGNRADPAWETVIDLDALARDEGENWVWHGATVLEPDDRLCLVSLSRGGADADVVREFDLETNTFVAGGFVLPEAKSRVAWRDRDSLLVATDFGSESLTTSGYPRTVRAWQRGTPLAAAELVYEGEPTDMVVSGFRDLTPGFERDFVVRRLAFYSSEWFLWRDGTLLPIEKPADANVRIYREWLLLELRSAWDVGGTTHPAGSLLAVDLEKFLEGDRSFHVLFTPTPRTSLKAVAATHRRLLLTTLDNVRSRISVLEPRDGGWQETPLPGVPEIGTATVTAVNDLATDEYFLITTSPVAPSTLAFGDLATGDPAVPLKRTPAFFDAAGLTVSQHEAVSADGTRVPYFQIGPAELPLDHSTPTVLYGYGGFEIPLVPGYDPIAGSAWLERGRVYAIANIRGGGEFGPAWHQAALKERRPRAYEDFAAVAADLVARGVTSPRRLGIQGGSNGGLLVGNLYATRPELFGAVVCQVPLLDMRRFHTLLAGASWMGEYGNPDQAEEWAFIRGFSPYHLVTADRDYPPLLLTTSTRDDRVHPAHARKMTARLREFGKRVLSYENIEGGHGGAADNKQKAFMDALAWMFFERELAH